MKYLDYKFAHHHVHSEYSPWDAPVSLKKLVNYSKDLGYKTVTLTDHGTVSGWVKLASYCKDAGVRPIFGIEAYFQPDRHKKVGKRSNYHCVLLAKNKRGIENIFRMSEAAYLEGFYFDPRIDWDLLEKYHEGVICTTSCVSGIVPDTLSLSPTDESLIVTDAKGNPILKDKQVQFRDPYEVAKEYALRLQKIFGPDLYAEVQNHNLGIEKGAYSGVSKLAKEIGMQLVGTNDVHYLRKEDCSTQETMMALNLGKCIKDPKRMKHETNQLYLKSPEEMLELFGGRNTQAVQGALEIAEKCDAQLEFGKTQLPSADIPKEFGDDDLAYLDHLGRDGMSKKGLVGKPDYEARYTMEMDVIRRLKEKGRQFDRYFLIVWDYCNWARNNGIRVGVGRGSGCGSLVLYCLGITNLDPLPYDLLFERFLDEERNEMPDIDTDFEAEKGHLVYEYICKKYGFDHTARINTTSVFHVASAIKAAFKVFDPGNNFEKTLTTKEKAQHAKDANKNKWSQRNDSASSDYNETARIANEITKLLPTDPNGQPSSKCTLLKETYDKKPEEYTYVYADQQFVELRRKYPDEFAFAEKIEGLLNGRSVHASGVVITRDPLVNLCPQQLVGKQKTPCTAFDMIDLEKLGVVKFDVLHTKVLSVISRCLKMIQDRYNVVVDIDNVPVNDKKALDVFAKGNTTGIFQFESRGMRDLLRNMSLTCFEDVIAANALFRPGPMEFIPVYCARKTGKEKVSYPFSVLEQVLKPTYGIMVYQEQVMKITRVLSSFSGSEADKVRKAMGKKKKDVLDAMKDKFVKGATTGGHAQDAVERLWGSMEAFGAYAFNKSHAAAYSYTAYQGAYLKAHYPAEFMAAQLTVEGWDSCHDVVQQYENACKEMGITVKAPDINKSKADYIVIDMPNNKKGLLKGFKGIGGLGEQAYTDIVAGQPYKSINDYCKRGGRGVNINVFKALWELGAFDCFLDQLAKSKRKALTRNDLLIEYNEQVKNVQDEKKFEKNNEGLGSIFEVTEENDVSL